MCFFVAQFAKLSQVRTRYWNSVLKDTAAFSEHFIANGFAHPLLLVVRQENDSSVLEMARWGLIPHWCQTQEQAHSLARQTLNAKSETMMEKPSYSYSATYTRCLVPVNGFYEWQHQGRQKQPYYIHTEPEDIFSLGALYSEWTNPSNGAINRTFSIVTVAANPLMASIHNTQKRMPLIIAPADEMRWLSSTSKDEITTLACPYPEKNMAAHPISPFDPRSASINRPSIMADMRGGLLF